MKNQTKCLLVSLSLLTTSFTALSGNQETSSGNSEVSPPVPIKTVTPVINRSSLKDGLTVEMKFTVNEAGRAVKIDPTVGFQGLRSQQRDFAAALKSALNDWQFEPARDANGQAVEHQIIIPFTYREEKGGSITARAFAKKTNESPTLASSEK